MLRLQLNLLVVLICSLSACSHFYSLFGNASDAPDLGTIPPRPYYSMTGSEFIKKTWYMSLEQRERAILREVKRGNIPDFLRVLRPVHFSSKDSRGRVVKATVWVMPDYLAIGSDEDYVRIPMNPMTAQKIADYFGFILPTTKIVDHTYSQAKLKLSPAPLRPGSSMTTNSYYLTHNKTIDRQTSSRDMTQLVAGHKKDIVITNRLAAKPKRVAIYGWHRKNGKAIQPLSLVHGNYYADYSHGLRLVSHTMRVDGVERTVTSILKDPNYAKLISYEGKMERTRIYLDDLRAEVSNTPATPLEQAGLLGPIALN